MRRLAVPVDRARTVFFCPGALTDRDRDHGVGCLLKSLVLGDVAVKTLSTSDPICVLENNNVLEVIIHLQDKQSAVD